MKISCDVILDLIPLVKDGVASEESTSIVNEHIKNCERCKTEFDIIEATRVDQPSIKDKKIISAIKRSVFITQFAILIIGTIIGVALTDSMDMFYNFIIMPVIGGVSLFAFKKKWYLTPIMIFVLSYLWQTIRDMVVDGFHWIILYSRFYYSMIYAILVCLGVVIVKLLIFAFKKEGV
ncbi:MAG: zf-HC2 domain-containing protein [Tissierellia bacterium]|nr:zf-HC2 domain-containing protein [Tissierellia bacterium]